MRARVVVAVLTVRRANGDVKLLAVADCPAGASLMAELRNVEIVRTATGEPWAHHLTERELASVQDLLALDLARQLRGVRTLDTAGQRIATATGWRAHQVEEWLAGDGGSR